MKTPFTTEQFFNIFEKYNLALFPIQLIFILLGIIGLFLLHSRYRLKSKLTGGFLGLLWIWMGLVYHISFFSEINKAAFVFGGIFILQGLLILINTFIAEKLTFNFIPQTRDYFGYFFIVFGLLIYPVISYFAVGSAVRTIALGLPCPSTILTLGFFMLTNNKFPKYLLIIPSLWAIVGLSAAINLGVYQDFMIFVAALMANIFLVKRKINGKAPYQSAKPDRIS